ncbi:TAFII55 protein conserved region-domain-containing protein, partial [Neohortaea acidophila]
MSAKLKLNTTGKASSPTPSAASATATPASGSGFKLKLHASQPPTPATETPVSAGPAKSGKAAAGKKRAANDDTISPAPKRPNKKQGTGPSLARKISIKLGPGPSAAAAPVPSTRGIIKLPLKKKSAASQPKVRGIIVRNNHPPPRIPGHGYDSEDSDAEEDPAVQQAFILRMEPGEDCEYIREAIANGKIGLPPDQNPAAVSLRFLDKDYRRAIVNVRGRMYAAAMVDLPCVVETMKSWDRKGWWKVADVCQMLLVLGPVANEEQAKKHALPREVDPETMQYAHGLTPPMKYVRKRRFRKRLSYKTIANVEEEVERLLKEDELAELNGGEVTLEYIDRSDLERGADRDTPMFEDEEGNAIETAMFDEDAKASATPVAADLISDSPAPIADQAASFSAVKNAVNGAAGLAAGADAQTSDEDAPASSDEDDDDDESDADSPDVMDEDAAAAAAERNQQMQEVADLEKEVEAQRVKVSNTTNQLLKQRAVAQLRALEEDLRVKRDVL